jgi:hypothetical protein
VGKSIEAELAACPTALFGSVHDAHTIPNATRYPRNLLVQDMRDSPLSPVRHFIEAKSSTADDDANPGLAAVQQFAFRRRAPIRSACWGRKPRPSA